MMFKEITLYVSDDQLRELGNAIAAYGRVLYMADLGLPPLGFEELSELSSEELKHRMEMLKQLHKDLSK